MKVYDFLAHHCKNSFASSIKTYINFLNPLKRKYDAILFPSALVATIDEWIEINKSISSEENPEKIKTNLAVDNLAYLFRILSDNSLISKDNQAITIRVVSSAFESKTKAEYSQDNFDKHFRGPQTDAIEYWIYWFKKLLKAAEDDLQKKLR